MQDLKALEGKSLVELREIAKAIGIGDTTLKKRELIEKIAGFSASEGAPAENKEKRGRGRKKEVPATEMQQTAAIAEPAAVKAEAAPETVPQAPRGRRPRITNTKTENTAPAQRPPITVAGPPAEPELPMESVPAPAPAAAAETVQAPREEKAEPKRRGRKPKAQAQAQAQEEAAEPAAATPPAAQAAQATQATQAAADAQSFDGEVITKDDFAGEIEGEGVLEIMPDGYGFLRSADYDYLKEKVGERKTRTEAYCDLLDKSLAGFVSPFLRKQDYDLGPCQCHVTVSDLASEWHWHRATVRSFLDTLEAFGQLERIRLAKSVIITMHLRIGTPDMPDSGQKETDFATRIQGILYDWVIGKATSFDVGKSCGQMMRQTLAEITGQDSRAYPDNHSGTTSVHTLRSEEQLRETVLECIAHLCKVEIFVHKH